MSFLDLVQKHSAYANEFFDYMIAKSDKKIQVAEYMSDKELQDAEEAMTGTCFICAEREQYKNNLPKQVLVLDAFSREDQFVEPV
jgi:hypothetical protein